MPCETAAKYLHVRSGFLKLRCPVNAVRGYNGAWQIYLWRSFECHRLQLPVLVHV